ncbi:Siroheme synthase [Gracilariopsis chorda]|uniref:uroporphyrinogen-III C-methyltransferase n=1 Tax=Gracilariopsis chorda TaxID=448386 RepID=A0A2V3IBM4_9FLOR|nr:Siroheme synthase [Gracilariopsis chorda]|eukprot:PXF39504.1 Siroheme synthase [Gracilariopsis chorda]
MAFITPLPLGRPAAHASRSRALANSRKQLCTRRVWHANAPPPHARLQDDAHSQLSIDTLLSHLREQHGKRGVQALRQASTQSSVPPKVHLVGTGPGDASLLTLRSLHHMQTADVILYDRLVSSEILTLCNRNAQLIYVGKQSGFHTRSQEDIHLLLNFFSARHQKVVRLKGGDPFVFGRGGEEVDFLESRGTSVCVTAGITAAAGIAAELGMPLTKRNVADSVRFITGHTQQGRQLDVGAVDERTTYVVYMGLQQLKAVAEQMAVRGLRADTPCVAVQDGTTRRQRIVCGELSEIGRRVEAARLQSPTLLFVGKVVRLAKVWGLELVEGRLLEEVDVSVMAVVADGLGGGAAPRSELR